VAAQHVDELRPLDVRGTVDPHQAATGADELQQVLPPLGIGEPTLAHQVAGGDTVIQMPQLNVDQLPCRYAWMLKISGVGQTGGR
jgi:hypothetical protein